MKKAILVLSLLISIVAAQTPLTDTFNYQDELKFYNALASEIYDFELSVFNTILCGAL